MDFAIALDAALHMLNQLNFVPSSSSILATADDIGAAVSSLQQISHIYTCFQYIEKAMLLFLNPKKMSLIPFADEVTTQLTQTIRLFLQRFAPKWRDIPVVGAAVLLGVN
eukprot:1014801-Karenia_brevis.AAC.1